MYADINFHSSISEILRYNERKVEKNVARLIHASGFLNHTERLSYQEKYHRFQHQNELNERTRMNMVHISLSFDRTEGPAKDELQSISDKYMAGIGLQDQPYLVYEHYDAERPHIHIVTNLIRRDGTSAYYHNMKRELSIPVCKEIEKEYKLVGGNSDTDYALRAPLALSETLQKVIDEYKFTSFTEYNAILKQYDLNAFRGSPDSFLYQHRGLVYLRLDEEGKQVGPPVKASRISFKPGISYLEQKFEENKERQREDIASIQRRIDWSLFQNSSSLANLVSSLRRDDIELVTSHNNTTENAPQWVYIDNRSRTVIEGSAIGEKYEAETILSDLKFSEKLQVPGLNPKVPQVVFELLERDRLLGRSENDITKEQKIEYGLGL